MTLVAYTLEVDWNNDGDYLDTNEDITADLRAISCRRGRDHAVGAPGSAPVTAGKLDAELYNVSGTYSPQNASSPIYGNIKPGRRVRWRTAGVRDTFTRSAGAALGRPDLGAAWTAITGTWGIDGGRAYSVSDSGTDIAVVSHGLVDCTVEAVVSGALTNASHYRLPCLAFKSNSAGTTYLFLQPFLTSVGLRKRQSGSDTSLTSGAFTFANETDYTLRVDCAGPTLRVYVNGTLLFTYTLSSADAATFVPQTYAGLRLNRGGTPAYPARFDSFKAYPYQSVEPTVLWTGFLDRIVPSKATPGSTPTAQLAASGGIARLPGTRVSPPAGASIGTGTAVGYVLDEFVRRGGSGVMTLSGNEITDALRTAAAEGDGLAQIDSSVGVWMAATNLFPNGGAETNLTSIVARGAGTTVTRQTTAKKFGSYGVQVDVTNTAADKGLNLESGTGAAATVYYASLWVKGVGGQVYRLAMDCLDSGFGYLTTIGYITFTATGGWQRVSTSGTSPASTAYVNIIVSTDTARTETFYVDGVQLEAARLTPYKHTDGGTAARTVGRVQAPATGLSATQGWVAARLRSGWANANEPGGGAGAPAVFDWRQDANNRISLEYDETNNRWRLTRVVAGVAATVTVNDTVAVGDLITLVASWDSANLYLSVDGAAASSAASATAPTITATTFDLGGAGGATVINSDILWALAGTGTLTDTNRATIHAYGNGDPPAIETIPGVCILHWPADTAALGGLSRALDTGQTTINRWFVRDHDALSAIRDIEGTEVGLFYERADGAVVFEDRHHRYKNDHLTAQFTVSDANATAPPWAVAEVDDLDSVVNAVEVSVQPYAEGSGGQVLWRYDGILEIGPGQTKTVIATYPNAQYGASDGAYATAWVTPVLGTDYSVGGSEPAFVTIATSFEPDAALPFVSAGAMVLRINHSHPTWTAQIIGLQARGTPVTKLAQYSVTATDAASQATYGRHVHEVRAPWLPSVNEAQSLADWTIATLKDPQALITVDLLANRDQTMATHAIQREISDRVTITAANQSKLGVSARAYYIESIRHQARANQEHVTTWELSPAPAAGYWLLDSNDLGVSTVLAH